MAAQIGKRRAGKTEAHVKQKNKKVLTKGGVWLVSAPLYVLDRKAISRYVPRAIQWRDVQF